MDMRACIARMVTDRRGSVAIMVALVFLAMLGMVGIAIDFARGQLAASRAHYAMDAAVLALARSAGGTAQETREDVNTFFNANFPERYMGTTVVLDTRTTTVGDTLHFVYSAAITMQVDLPLVFGGVIESLSGRDAPDSVRITRTAAAQFASESSVKGGMEIVLVLDDSGSMRNDVQALKNGANALLDMLFEGKETRDNLYVGLVHYNGMVNVHSQLADTAGFYSPARGNGKYVTGCTIARRATPPTAQHLTAATPATRPFQAREYTSSSYMSYCPPSSRALTNKRSDIDATLAAYKAEGFTMIMEGVAWGWRMLSPTWRGIWKTTGPVPLPLDPTSYMEKILVVMTDGYNDDGTSIAHNAYNEMVSSSTLDADFLTACNNAKAAGIKIYTITYGSSPNKTLIRSCATTASMYFHAALPSDLKTAFTKVGTDLTEVRLTR